MEHYNLHFNFKVKVLGCGISRIIEIPYFVICPVARFVETGSDYRVITERRQMENMIATCWQWILNKNDVIALSVMASIFEIPLPMPWSMPFTLPKEIETDPESIDPVRSQKKPCSKNYK